MRYILILNIILFMASVNSTELLDVAYESGEKSSIVVLNDSVADADLPERVFGSWQVLPKPTNASLPVYQPNLLVEPHSFPPHSPRAPPALTA